MNEVTSLQREIAAYRIQIGILQADKARIAAALQNLLNEVMMNPESSGTTPLAREHAVKALKGN